jgi:hypothetical protein
MPDWLIVLLLFFLTIALAWWSDSRNTPGSTTPILPIGEDPKNLAPPELAASDAAKQPVFPVGKGMKVLLITDETEIGSLFQIILKCAGHEVRYIGDASFIFYFDREKPSHIQIVNEGALFSPDWIVMQLKTQDPVSYIDLASAMHEKLPATRFFFFSAYPYGPEELDRISARVGVFFQFRFMPFPTEDLLAVIKQAA